MTSNVAALAKALRAAFELSNPFTSYTIMDLVIVRVREVGKPIASPSEIGKVTYKWFARNVAPPEIAEPVIAALFSYVWVSEKLERMRVPPFYLVKEFEEPLLEACSRLAKGSEVVKVYGTYPAAVPVLRLVGFYSGNNELKNAGLPERFMDVVGKAYSDALALHSGDVFAPGTDHDVLVASLLLQAEHMFMLEEPAVTAADLAGAFRLATTSSSVVNSHVVLVAELIAKFWKERGLDSLLGGDEKLILRKIPLGLAMAYFLKPLGWSFNYTQLSNEKLAGDDYLRVPPIMVPFDTIIARRSGGGSGG